MLKLPSVFTGPVAMAGSLALHLGAAAGFARQVAEAAHPVDIEFAAVTLSQDAPEMGKPLAQPPASQPIARTVARVVTRHVPSRAPAPGTAIAAAPQDTGAPIPHFSLPALSALAEPPRLAVNATLSSSVPEAATRHDASALARAGPFAGSETFAEAAVDVPARLLASAPVAYPPQARSAGVESSVALEIVVDAHGRVIEARILAPVGYGLDEAALSAIRAYRFAPAQRFGRTVSVRMRWSVRFGLR